jgi:DNA-binding protein HU-beta
MAAKKSGAQTTVSLKHLAANLAESHELSKEQVEAVLRDVVSLVAKHRKKGTRVRIAGLETLTGRKRAEERMARDLAIGEPIPVKTSKKVAARAEVLGTTRDGVKILRPKIKPDHFTSNEIRKAVTQAKRAAG